MSNQLMVTSPRELQILEVPDPPLQAGQVRIAAHYLGISIGTELNAYRGGVNWYTGRDPKTRLFYPDATPWEYPANLGYSHVGQVVEIGPNVTNVAVGDLVYSLAGHVTPAVVPAARVWPVPKGENPQVFVFLQLVKTALSVAQHAHPALGETVAVFGAGVVGLLTIQILKRAGAGKIIVFEPIAARREMALSMGADVVLDPLKVDAGHAVRDHNAGRGADIAVEASGNAAAVRQCPRAVEPQGLVVLAALYQKPVEMPLGQESHFNSIRYLSAHVIRIPREMNPLWTLDRRDELARQLLSELDLQPLITHTYDFKEAPQVYRMLDENPGDAISVILRCPDAN